MASGRLKRLLSTGVPVHHHENYSTNDVDAQDDANVTSSQNESLILQHPIQLSIPPRELLANLANAVADPSISSGIHRAACLHRGAMVFAAFLACVRLEQKLDDTDVSNARALFASITKKATNPRDDDTGANSVLTSFKSKAKAKMTASVEGDFVARREEARRVHIARQAASAAALEALPVYDGKTSERLPPCLKPLRDLLVDLLSACNDDVESPTSPSSTRDPNMEGTFNDASGTLVYVPALIGILCAGVVLYCRQNLSGFDKARRRKEARVSLALALFAATLSFFPSPASEPDFSIGIANMLITAIAPTYAVFFNVSPRSPSASQGSPTISSSSLGAGRSDENRSVHTKLEPPTPIPPIVAESLRSFACFGVPPEVDLEVEIRRFANSLQIDRRKVYADAGKLVFAVLDNL